MKNLPILLTVLLILNLMTAPVKAQDRTTGVGIMVGDPVGLNAKAWFSEDFALDAGLSLTGESMDDFYLHLDALWHLCNWKDGDNGVAYFYVGLGGRLIWTGNDERLGVRVPIGFTWVPGVLPLDFFLEMAPTGDLEQGDISRPIINGVVGVRFYY